MSIKNFKFVSPGVFINEIDNSFRPRSPEAIGPVVIGRATKGLAMEPITVESFSEFVEMFGDTVPGNAGGDVYRNGNLQSPMYGTYAAKAFLRSNVAPLTYMRLLGQQTTTNDGSVGGRAGWQTTNTLAVDASADETAPSNGGAYGLFLFASGSTGSGDVPDGFAASATLTVADAGEITTGNTISLVTAGGDTVTITGHGSANAMTTTSGASADGTFDASTASGGSTNNIAQALAIATTINLHDDFTASTGGTAVVTVTQNTKGTAGNSASSPSAAAGSGGGDITDASHLTIVTFSGGTEPRDAGNMGTGSCAAIWYLQNGKIQLSGNLVGGADGATASAGAYIGSDSNGNYKVLIKSATQGEETFLFNFNDNSENFIRNQFNTNPQLGSAGDFYPTSAEKDYWLGESYEQNVREEGLHNTAGIGIILGLGSGSTAGSSIGPHLMKGQASREAVAGWFISQDVGAFGSYTPQSMQKLFRLKGRGHGEWLHKNLKVSIERIRQSNTQLGDYGSFSVVLRKLTDTDNNVQVVERYDNCNLDPTSPNFVARKIGDRYSEWDEVNQRLRYYGEYDNKSRYIYVEMNDDVEAGATEASLLPFGYFGAPVMSGSGAVTNATDPDTEAIHKTMLAWSGSFAGFAGETGLDGFDGAELLGGTSNNLTASFKFPKALLRKSASDGGLTDPTKAYFGFRTTRTATSNNSDPSVADLLWISR